MHRNEAKQLLELCRPGNEADRHDPALARAFALLENDAELQDWFDEQQALDARISESLNALEAPADLKADILAGMRLHHAHNEASSPRHGPETPEISTHTWWLNPWTGIAALFVIVMALLSLPESNPASEGPASPLAVAGLPPVLQFLSQELDSLKSSDFEKRDSQAANLQAYLVSTRAPSPRNIPACLAKMSTLGCITFEYGNAKFSMICFKNGEVYHLITAEKAHYPDPLPIEPAFFQGKDKAFRVWIDGEQIKILTVRGTREDIPEFI
jgi:hypothetical protein